MPGRHPALLERLEDPGQCPGVDPRSGVPHLDRKARAAAGPRVAASRPSSASVKGSRRSEVAQATAKARKAGKNPGSFDRVIFYVTKKACGDNFYGVAGIGSMPGSLRYPVLIDCHHSLSSRL